MFMILWSFWNLTYILYFRVSLKLAYERLIYMQEINNNITRKQIQYIFMFETKPNWRTVYEVSHRIKYKLTCKWIQL